MRTTTAWIAVGMLLGAAAVGADEVSLSHVIVKVGGGGGTLADIDVAATQRFCGDADGCEIVIALRGDITAGSMTGRVFLDTDTGVWFSPSSGTYYTDGNNVATTVLTLAVSPNTCTVADGEGVDGFDTGPGFDLNISGTDLPDASCTITISD